MQTSSSLKTLLLVVVSLLIGLPILGVLAMGITKKSGMMNREIAWVGNSKSGGVAATRVGTMMGSAPAMMGTEVFNLQDSDTSVGDATTLEYRTGATAQIAPMPPEYSQPGSFTPTEDRLFIKNAWLSLEVKDPQESSKNVTQLAQNKGGIVTNLQMDTYRQDQGIVTANMTIRVPVANLDSFVEETKKLAKTVLSEQLNVDDATERAVDLDAQLTNLRATETQLLSIMAQAKTVEDTLRVQQELTNTRDRIERLQAQRDNLSGAAAMSTVQLTLTTDAGELPIVDGREPGIKEEIKNTIRNAVQLYRALFVVGLKLTILASPLIVVAALAWFFFRRRKASLPKS